MYNREIDGFVESECRVPISFTDAAPYDPRSQYTHDEERGKQVAHCFLEKCRQIVF